MHVGYLGKSSAVASKEEDWVTGTRRSDGDTTQVTLSPAFLFFFLTFIILTYVPVSLIEESTNLR